MAWRLISGQSAGYSSGISPGHSPGLPDSLATGHTFWPTCLTSSLPAHLPINLIYILFLLDRWGREQTYPQGRLDWWKSGNLRGNQRETSGPTKGPTKDAKRGWKNEILGNNAGLLRLAMV